MLRRAGLLLLLVATVSLAVRLTLRDRLPLLAAFFYATPLTVVATLLVAAAACLARAHRSAAAGTALLALVVAVAAFRSGWRSAAGDGAATLRVVQWNVSHRGDATWTRTQAATFDADVMVFVETGRVSEGAQRAWSWPAVLATNGFLVLAKDAIEDHGAIDVGSGARARHVVARSNGRALSVVAVDVKSDPLQHRKEALTRLRAAVDRIEGPLVVAGDFNTPADSFWFDAFRGRFVNAFEAAGDGWAGTWPAKRALPVLQLDHVWARDVRVVRAKHGWVAGFDHRPVLADLQLP